MQKIRKTVIPSERSESRNLLILVKYTIFKTKWGYFGLAATDNGLLRTCLPPSSCFACPRVSRRESGRRAEAKQRGPAAGREKVKSQLLCYFPSARYDKDLFRTIQKQITAYFEGDYVDFRDVPVVLNTGAFTMRVLEACRSVRFGQIVTYGRLAELAGRPGSARAVGMALAKNPLPLIIPCHRIVCADGSLGGFSAFGGIGLKKRLLELEARSLK